MIYYYQNLESIVLLLIAKLHANILQYIAANMSYGHTVIGHTIPQLVTSTSNSRKPTLSGISYTLNLTLIFPLENELENW